MEIIIARKVYFSSGVAFAHLPMAEDDKRTWYGKMASSRYGTGFNYTLEVFLAGPINPNTGLVVNLTDIDPMLKETVAPLDHQNISFTVPEFSNLPATAENIARYCFDQIKKRLQAGPVRLERVRLYQGEDIAVDIVNTV